MKLKFKTFLFCFAACLIIMSFIPKKSNLTTVYLIGDSTMADYTNNYELGKDYMKTRYPITGWGQVFQQFFAKDSLKQVKNLIQSDSVRIDDRAKGGEVQGHFFRKDAGEQYMKISKKVTL